MIKFSKINLVAFVSILFIGALIALIIFSKFVIDFKKIDNESDISDINIEINLQDSKSTVNFIDDYSGMVEKLVESAVITYDLASNMLDSGNYSNLLVLKVNLQTMFDIVNNMSTLASEHFNSEPVSLDTSTLELFNVDPYENEEFTILLIHTVMDICEQTIETYKN